MGAFPKLISYILVVAQKQKIHREYLFGRQERESLHSYIHYQTERISEQFCRVSDNLNDKDITKLRSKLKKIRAAMDVAQACYPQIVSRSTSSVLKKLNKKLGDLRMTGLRNKKETSPMSLRDDFSRFNAKLNKYNSHLKLSASTRPVTIRLRNIEELEELAKHFSPSKKYFSNLKKTLRKARYTLDCLGKDSSPLKALSKFLDEDPDWGHLQGPQSIVEIVSFIHDQFTSCEV